MGLSDSTMCKGTEAFILYISQLSHFNVIKGTKRCRTPPLKQSVDAVNSCFSHGVANR